LLASYRQYCPAYDPTHVCQIPDQLTPPSSDASSTPPTYFFSMQGNHTTGQSTENTSWSTGRQHNKGSAMGMPAWSLFFVSLIFAFFLRQ